MTEDGRTETGYSAEWYSIQCGASFMTSQDKDLSAQASETAQSGAETPQNWRRWVWENVQVVAIALVLVLIIRTYIAEPRFIPSDSMLPTLETGDRVVVEKVSYRFHPPQPGDIIVFSPPPQLQAQGYQADQAFIKRVIGIPGQEIEIHDNRVYVNHIPLTEPYIAAPPQYQLPPFQVPAHALFVMGDNRNNSNDSHIWGFLPQNQVIGRAIFRFWPFPRVGGI
ncbi:signal peptidase I [Spirulina subsalsa FACHB-351]|uniref:Signal peptidase I n=2 Tax=Spirulina subsalsa TaxID=54311 RepID=A0ABT3L2F9_9CYAN|nr:signal peptidase I [Spirulina subsalsa FACHB-351]